MSVYAWHVDILHPKISEDIRFTWMEMRSCCIPHICDDSDYTLRPPMLHDDSRTFDLQADGQTEWVWHPVWPSKGHRL